MDLKKNRESMLKQKRSFVHNILSVLKEIVMDSRVNWIMESRSWGCESRG